MAGRQRNSFAPLGEDISPSRRALAQALRDLPAIPAIRELAAELNSTSATVSRILAGQVVSSRVTTNAITEVCGGVWDEIEPLWTTAMRESRGATMLLLHDRLDAAEARIRVLTKQLDIVNERLNRLEDN